MLWRFQRPEETGGCPFLFHTRGVTATTRLEMSRTTGPRTMGRCSTRSGGARPTEFLANHTICSPGAPLGAFFNSLLDQNNPLR
jgi:hypothetical protein